MPTAEGVNIDSDRTVVLSNLPKETKWKDVSWLVTYCGSVEMRRKFTCPKNAGDCIFVVMFESDQAAEDILLLADTEVRGRPLQVATVKVFRQRLTMQEVQVNVSGKIQRIGTVIQSQSQSGRTMGEAGSVCVSSMAPSECGTFTALCRVLLRFFLAHTTHTDTRVPSYPHIICSVPTQSQCTPPTFPTLLPRWRGESGVRRSANRSRMRSTTCSKQN